MLRPLFMLALVAVAASVVTQKDVKLDKDKEGSDAVKLDKGTEAKVAANATEPQAEGSARVSQHYPEDHVRLQHLTLMHPTHQVSGVQLLGGQQGDGGELGGQHAVRQYAPEQQITYQYYPVPVPVPVQVVQVPQHQQQVPQIQPSKPQEHHHTHLHASPPVQEQVKEHVVHHVNHQPQPQHVPQPQQLHQPFHHPHPHHHHQPQLHHLHQGQQYETNFIPSSGLAGQQHDELSGGVFGGNQQVHFPEQVDQHHLPHPHVPHIPHGHYDVAHQEHKSKNLKRVLLPLAGIALLGAAAALATNPVLLQLGVVSDLWRVAGRRRRSTQQDVPALTLEDLAEIEDLGPRPDEVAPFQNLTAGVRLKEIAVLQKFLKEQETGNKRSYGEGDALLSSMLSCSALLNPRNVACLQRLACEAYSVDTDLPELEMQVLRIVVREMASHEAIPKQLRKKVRMAVTTGRKGKCDFTYRCPEKAWEKCVHPNY